MDLWRLTKYRSLSGEGGRLYAARWNSAGAPIVYLADSPGSALVEILAHLEIEDDEIPTDFLWLRVTAPDSLVVPTLSTSNQEEWQSDVSFTRGPRRCMAKVTAIRSRASAVRAAASNV